MCQVCLVSLGVAGMTGIQAFANEGHRLVDVSCDVTVMKSDVTIDFSVDVARANVLEYCHIRLKVKSWSIYLLRDL